MITNATLIAYGFGHRVDLELHPRPADWAWSFASRHVLDDEQTMFSTTYHAGPFSLTVTRDTAKLWWMECGGAFYLDKSPNQVN